MFPNIYRPVGLAPDGGTPATTSRINETIDGSVFDSWRADATYRPPNLAAWAEEKKVDPAKLAGAVLARRSQGRRAVIGGPPAESANVVPEERPVLDIRRTDVART